MTYSPQFFWLELLRKHLKLCLELGSVTMDSSKASSSFFGAWLIAKLLES